MALCSSQIKRLIIPKCTKKWLNTFKKFYVIKKTPFSLSKWSNYPSSIRKVVSKKFCSKNFSSICERKKNSMALKYLKRIEKFKVFGFFLWIPHKHWFLLSFLYIRQWLASSLDKSTKLFFWKIKKWQKLYLYEASIKEIR